MNMITTILLVIYFSINTYIASEHLPSSKWKFCLCYLLGLPSYCLYFGCLILSALWWRISNTTDISFYIRLHVRKEFDNLSTSQIAQVRRVSTDDSDKQVKRWAKAVLKKYPKYEE